MSNNSEIPKVSPIKGALSKAYDRAFYGGVAGATAMGVQVGTMMWMRTTINYQYRHGGTMGSTLRTLYKEGGVPRFYRGLGPALLQGPLSRFGDTAANMGILELLNNNENTKDLNIGVKTMAASAGASLWRVGLMPIDALKTTMQVSGKSGLPNIIKKVKTNGFGVMYHGAGATVGATWIGHYPWFATYNYLNAVLPAYDDHLVKKLSRNAFIGFSASVVSDTISNSIRVIKTTKQTYETPITYTAAAKQIIKSDGIQGLMGRGLKTKILCNGIQGTVFAVAWKFLDEELRKRNSKDDDTVQIK